MSGSLEAVLSRHRAVTTLSLIVLVLLAWGWLLTGAGMGMEPTVSLSPPGGGGDVAGMAMDMPAELSPQRVGLIFAMWWIMMLAMMLPAAAPTILLYAQVAKQAQPDREPASLNFLLGYIAVWAAFSLLATTLHLALERMAIFSPQAMAFERRWISAGILIGGGLYQLTALKDACLHQCRNPAQFLSRYYKPGAGGALGMGVLHGAFCVGCCWLLMLLLFAGGVMNLAWIALLTLLVAAEKLLPFGRIVSRATGVALIMAGSALALS